MTKEKDINDTKNNVNMEDNPKKPRKKYKSKFDGWTADQIKEHKIQLIRKNTKNYYERHRERIKERYKNIYREKIKIEKVTKPRKSKFDGWTSEQINEHNKKLHSERMKRYRNKKK